MICELFISKCWPTRVASARCLAWTFYIERKLEGCELTGGGYSKRPIEKGQMSNGQKSCYDILMIIYYAISETDDAAYCMMLTNQE